MLDFSSNPMVQMIKRFTPSIIFLAQLIAGISLLLRVFDEISPTQSKCDAAFNDTIPATPCLREEGEDWSVVEWDGSVMNSVSKELMASLFFAGVVSTVFVHFVLYHHAKERNDGSFRARSDDLSFNDMLLYSAVSRQPRTVMTFVNMLSVVFWFVWLILYTDGEHSAFLASLNPHLSPSKYTSSLLRITCSSNRFNFIFLGDALLQGSVCVGVLLPLLTPSHIDMEHAFVLILDFLHGFLVIWSLPLGRYSPHTRAYNLYMISGVVRAVRVFHGAAQGAKHYGMLAKEEAVSTGGGGGRGGGADRNMLSRASKRFEHMMFDPRSSFFLMGGQVALGTRIFAFLAASALAVIAFEGWPCEYQVRDPLGPCDCYLELRDFRGALYFVSTTMTTVGFGDISPRSHIGRFAVLILIVCGVYLAPGWITQLQRQHAQFVKSRAFSRDIRTIRKNQVAPKKLSTRNDSTDTLGPPVMLGGKKLPPRPKNPRRSTSSTTKMVAFGGNSVASIRAPLRTASDAQIKPKTAEEMSLVADHRTSSFMEDFDFLDDDKPKETDGNEKAKRQAAMAAAERRRVVSLSCPPNMMHVSELQEVLQVVKTQQDHINLQRMAIERLAAMMGVSSVVFSLNSTDNGSDDDEDDDPSDPNDLRTPTEITSAASPRDPNSHLSAGDDDNNDKGNNAGPSGHVVDDQANNNGSSNSNNNNKGNTDSARLLGPENEPMRRCDTDVTDDSGVPSGRGVGSASERVHRTKNPLATAPPSPRRSDCDDVAQ